MGFYINPTDSRSKEDWLNENGSEILSGEADFSRLDTDKEHLVCLVDNGWMTAAGIAYNRSEYDVFANPSDRRPKRWFIVADNLLELMCPGIPLRPYCA